MIATLATLLLAAGQTQAAQQAERCTMRTAVAADVRAMAREPQRWLGRCVRLVGYVSYNHFYADVGGYYRYFASDYDDHRNDGWLGLYPRRRYGFRGPMQRGSVVGIVHDCESDQERSDAIMMMGFCHYRYGLVLREVSLRAQASVDFHRQTGDGARRAIGDLETAEEAGPLPPEVSSLFNRFILAVRAGDQATLQGLIVSNYGDEQDEHRRVAAERAFLLGSESPLAVLRAAREPQVAYFRSRLPRHVERPGNWHACFCKTADCSNVWPISESDATADPVRPYLCVEAFGQDYRRPADRIGVIRQSGYPLEPARTAIRRPSESVRR